ncbi:MAG: bifunctional 5,10-methylene-tetrahydrofolate dehydrogenase/5,10-methylene-tetrahydrofolate cyclohydrolase, partial [Lachnospiraceae bacterium]|nr:bifunctional 5,10-methylene-tetrahydrofolate dehydrogenase/5,10-methylene-tetrahydrofolate cyclohydrolase [Candidatus Equihabitans merdae]
METQLLKGKPVADAMDQKTIEDVSKLKDAGITPCLAVLRVGEKKDDIAYERSILKRAEKLGIAILSKVLTVESSQEEVKQCIISINEDASVHGILMFLPLPAHLDEKELVETICPEKDMDGVTSISKAGLYSGSHVGYPPCTPDGIMRILEFYEKDVAGKHVAVVGRSLVTGKPMAMMLLEKNATVSICHSRTPDLGAITRQADMVVVCT